MILNENYPKIINFKNTIKNNFFAPEWSYWVMEDIVKGINFKKLSKYLLKKEKELLKITKLSKKISVDGYTGLGPNSITSRYENFNLLKFNNEEIKKIKKAILNVYKYFLCNLKIDLPKNLWIQCWFNVMRKGEKINVHIHSSDMDSYLSGHLCVKVKNTSTKYIISQNQINDPEIYSSKNKVGKITIFQNCMPHFTDIHNSEEERITIAFDFIINNKYNDNNLIKVI
jgi:hypothetical protein